MDSSVTLAAALGAGFFSFFAPCALVLVPAFLIHLAGVGVRDVVGGRRLAVFWHTLSFVLGFTLVFTLLGASLGLVSQFVQGAQDWVSRVGGGLIILFGLVQAGLVPIPWLRREYRLPEVAPGNLKYLGSLVVGSVFAVAWTPCVGPVLGSILVLAGVSSSAREGALLLSVYSLGLALPFLAVGLSGAWVSRFLRAGGRWLRYYGPATGVLLIILGIVVFTGRFTELVGYLFFLGR